MANIPTKKVPTGATEDGVNGVSFSLDQKAQERLENRFRQLESTWTAETGHHSSPTKIIKHPAFQEIIGLGPDVVPLMLRDLEKRPRLWVWALPEILGVNPIPDSERGNIAKMSQRWLLWAKEHN